LYRGIVDFKKGYQPGTNVAKGEKGDLITDSHRLSQYFSLVEEPFLSDVDCTVHGVNDVRQTEIHTTEPLVSEPSAIEVEVANEKLKRQITWY